MASARTRARAAGSRPQGYRLGQPNWPTRVAQISNCFSNQFEVPLLFYILIALALPLRHADLFIVLMSWVFVSPALRMPGSTSPQQYPAARAGVVRRRAGAAGDVDLFRLKILLLI